MNIIFRVFQQETKDATRLFFLPVTTAYNSLMKNIKEDKKETNIKSATMLFFSPLLDIVNAYKKELQR